MSSREYILSRAKNSAARVEKHEPTPDPAVHIKITSEDLTKDFINKIEGNKAIVIESDKDNLVNEINKIIKNEGVTNLIYGKLAQDIAQEVDIENKFEFKNPVESFKDRLFDYDVSIVKARGAVSTHGLTCIPSSHEQPRLLSLTPKVCIALVDKTTIVGTISEQLNKIKEEDGRLPTNVNFVSGPSKTADIELITVIGVHGSQIFYVIVY